jgi:hypothetical protein
MFGGTCGVRWMWSASGPSADEESDDSLHRLYAQRHQGLLASTLRTGRAAMKTKSGHIVTSAGFLGSPKFWLLSPFTKSPLTCKCCRVLYYEDHGTEYRAVCCGKLHGEAKAEAV